MKNAPIRIALALDYCDPVRGGLEAWVLKLATWLSERNYEVSLVATGGKATNSLSLYTAPTPSQPWPKARILTELAKSLKADLMHDTGVLFAADIFHPQTGSRIWNSKREMAARPLTERARLAFSPGLARWRCQTKRLEERQLRSAGKIVAVSRLVASDLQKVSSFDAGKLEIIPNGICTAPFETAPAADKREASRNKWGLRDEVLFVMSAHNFLLKGVGTAIEALTHLTEDEQSRVRVYLAGNGNIAHYQAYAARHGVGKCVRFLGHVSDMAELYNAADVSLHPTFYDACSLSTLEAIASGLPVITTAFNGASDFIDHEKDGIILPTPSAPHLLASAMKRMLFAAERDRLKTALKEKAGQVSQEINFSRIEDLYRRILLEKQG